MLKKLKNIFKTTHSKSNGTSHINTPTTPQKKEKLELNQFTINLFPNQFHQDEFMFDRYFKMDGEWVEEGEKLCEIKIKNRFKKATIGVPKSGILEWTVDKDQVLEEKMVFFKIHNKGEYKKENLPEHFEFKHYFYKDELLDNNNPKFDKWLINDGDFVEKGNEIYQSYHFNLEIAKREEKIYLAEKTGYIDLKRITALLDIEHQTHMYTIRDTDSQRIREKFNDNFIPLVKTDDFNGLKTINWLIPKGIITNSDNDLIELFFSFNFIQTNDFIIFRFNPKEIQPKKDDEISFLFIDGTKLNFVLQNDPITLRTKDKERFLSYKSPITKAELELFSNIDFKKWKISLKNEKREILGGTGKDFINFSQQPITMYNLNILIKTFLKKYIACVKKEIQDYQPLEIRHQKEMPKLKSSSCSVYLMHDTSNNYYKIGISNKPKYRERTLQSEKPTIEIIISKSFPIRKIAESFEKSLHQAYSDKRIRGEWFELNKIEVEDIITSLK